MERTQRTVLLVDDDEEVLEFTGEVIASFGYRVLRARDGSEALATLRREPTIDLLFTDIRMPGMDGWELARTTTAAYPHVKVIYTTGFADALPDHVEGSPATLLRKPWRARDIEKLLRRILDNVKA